jgi:hypothetical protein
MEGLLESQRNEHATDQLKIDDGGGPKARKGGPLSINVTAWAGKGLFAASNSERLYCADHRPALSDASEAGDSTVPEGAGRETISAGAWAAGGAKCGHKNAR